jgi:hypothetical protein
LQLIENLKDFLFYSLSFDDLIIRSGNINITAGQLHKVVKVFVHEDYAFDLENSLPNDIAIAEVKHLSNKDVKIIKKHCFSQVSPPFIFGPNVQPIKLPNQGDVPAVGSVATVIGWGNTVVSSK